MSLEKELQRLLELDIPWDEAQKKFSQTYMFVNGELEYVRGFIPDHNSLLIYDIKTACNKEVKVKSLDVWLPETGIYHSKEGVPYLIIKQPKRQWLKSFSQSYYRCQNMGGAQVDEYNIIRELSLSKKKIIFVDKMANIYYLTTNIGYITNDHNIVCVDGNFEQELRDWNNNEKG